MMFKRTPPPISRYRKFLNRYFNGSTSILVFLLLLAFGFVLWCWVLANEDFSPLACNGTRVTGWGSGGYTNLCIERN